MSKQRGLPQQRRMRHDSHFVEEITAQRTESIGKMIDSARIEPNPHQPRKDFGDLTDMVASVKEKGILEPILVRSHEGNYRSSPASAATRPHASPVSSASRASRSTWTPAACWRSRSSRTCSAGT